MKKEKRIVITVEDKDGIVAMVASNGKEMTFYGCERMGMDDLDALLGRIISDRKEKDA